MLSKIRFFFLFSFLFATSLLAEDNEIFAGLACRLVSHNRSVLHCELQQKRILVIKTVDAKELKLLCVWFPEMPEEEYRLDDVVISLGKETDCLLIGYGQTAGNPMFYYCLPMNKVSKKMKMERWEKYRIPLSLCDYRFE